MLIVPTTTMMTTAMTTTIMLIIIMIAIITATLVNRTAGFKALGSVPVFLYSVIPNQYKIIFMAPYSNYLLWIVKGVNSYMASTLHEQI